ncbi:hypothetical protein PRZ48_007986 [Zasmidium cellare]|uniref:AIG1-type G domain-containing protein n=1 Tax=Zasmidium cellare TaxID=395010 RepID=A0ABR0EFA2_ZASCE|nr:hypothetical protein PRZ48_007986 [Zasmidium cellare]
MDERSALMRSIEPIGDMILVMGVTGAGKSHFINCLAGEGSAEEYHGLQSGTKKCDMVPVSIGYDGTRVAIVDTPGFDDSSGSDVNGLTNIVRFLTSQYKLGIRLQGVIYLHRITDVKMAGSALANFELFRDLCGDQALSNTVLLTTMWGELRDPSKGWDRQHELREHYWGMMESRGAHIGEFDGTKESAEAVVGFLVDKEEHIVLKVQEEIGQEGKPLKDTTAGKRVMNQQRKKMNDAKARFAQDEVKKHEAEISKLDARVDQEVEAACKKNRLEKWMAPLQLKPELWKKIRWLESENTHLTKSLQAAESNAEALQQSRKQLVVEANRLEEEKAELQQRVNELEYAEQEAKVERSRKNGLQLFEEIERLRRENEQHVKAISELRQDNSRIAGEVIRLRTENNQKSSDEYFVKAWDSLRYSISDWAFKHFQGQLALPKDFKADWEIASLVGDVASYLKSEKRRWLLVQSFVWRQLEDKVLHRAAVLWAGQHRHALRKLIEAVEDVQEAAEEGVVERTLKVLLPYTSSASGHGSPCRGELLEIVLKAIALSKDFDQQRALFKVCRPEGPRGEEFDIWCNSRSLQSENGSSQDGDELFAKLVKIPGLHRYGDVDGAGKFDDEVVIVKAVVESEKSRAKKSDGNLRRAPTRLRRHGQQVDVNKSNEKQRGGQDVPKRRPVQVVEQDPPRKKSLEATRDERPKTIPRKSVQDQSQESTRSDTHKYEKPLPPSPKVKSFGDRAKKLLSPRKLMIDEERDQWQRKYDGTWPNG